MSEGLVDDLVEVELSRCGVCEWPIDGAEGSERVSFTIGSTRVRWAYHRGCRPLVDLLEDCGLDAVGGLCSLAAGGLQAAYDPVGCRWRLVSTSLRPRRWMEEIRDRRGRL